MGQRSGQPSDIEPAFRAPAGELEDALAGIQPVQDRLDSEQAPAAAQEAAPIQQEISPAGVQVPPTQAPQAPQTELQSALSQIQPVSDDLPSEVVDGGPGAGILARFKASFGRNLKESKAILENSAFGKGNVKVEDGELFFRKNKKDPFKKVDPDDEFSFADLAGDIADVGGDIAEIATAVVGEVVLSPFATPLGAAAITAAASAAARDRIVTNLFQADDEDIDLMTETLKSAGFAIAGFGITRGLSKGWSGLKSAYGKFKAGTQLSRIKALADVNIVLDDTIKAVNNGNTISASQAGTTLDNALTTKKNALQIAVGTQEDDAIAKAGDEFFTSTGMLNQMKQVLEEQGAKFDKDGFITRFKPKTTIPELPSLPIDEISPKEFERIAAGFSSREKAIEEVAESARLTTMFKGDRGGQQAMRETVETYNSFLASTRNNQGVDLRTMINSIKKFQAIGFRKEEFGPSVREAMRKIEHSGIQDRHSALGKVLTGQGKKIIDDAYSNFSNSIDSIMDITGSIGRKDSPEMFAQAVIKKGNAKRVKDLKFITGEDSEAFRQVKAAWMTSITEKSSQSGVLFGKQFMKEIKSYGGDVVKEMFTPAEFGKIKTLAKRSERIFKTDLLSEADKAAIQDMAFVFLPQTFLPTRVRAATNLLGGKKAGDYLLDEGFMQMMRKTGSNTERLQIMELQQALTKASVAKGALPNRPVTKVIQDNVSNVLKGEGVPTEISTSIANQVSGFGTRKIVAPEPETIDLPPLNINVGGTP